LIKILYMNYMNNLAHIVLLFISLFFINKKSLHNKSNKTISSILYVSHQKNIDLDLTKFKNIKVPFGNKNLASTTFPESWKHVDFSDNNSEGRIIKSKITDAYFKSEILFDRYNNSTNTKYFNFIDTFESNYEEDEQFKKLISNKQPNISIPLLEFSYFPFVKFNLNNSHLILIFYLKNETKYLGFTKMLALCLNKNNQLIDFLDIYLSDETKRFVNQKKMFYIDKKNIFHIKDFIEFEDHVAYKNYEQYQCTDSGKFIRYYKEEGTFKNDFEQGFVKHNKREGLWIEQKKNSFLFYKNHTQNSNQYTYLEATYKDGLPIGEWKFYELLQEYDEKGQPIISTRKKGILLYAETYSNGELQNRKFVN
jgi:hypothetical protein